MHQPRHCDTGLADVLAQAQPGTMARLFINAFLRSLTVIVTVVSDLLFTCHGN